MQRVHRRSVLLGLTAGAALLGVLGVLMGQGASQPVRSETQYFVTGEGDEAHVWVREGVNLRCVGHGECHTAHQHDHADGDGHNHGKDGTRK